MKTSELSGAALDWAVAKAEDRNPSYDKEDGYVLDAAGYVCTYSTDWSQGGPIIEHLMLKGMLLEAIGQSYRDTLPGFKATLDLWWSIYRGDTPLIAAMRCYVASKLGEEVDIPEELK